MTKEEFQKELDGVPEEKQEMLLNLFDESQKNYELKVESFKGRDDYKAKLKKAEEERQLAMQKLADAEKKKAEEEGEFRSLYETEAEKNARLAKELEENKEYRTKYEEIEQERRAELIGRLPEGELREVAETITDRTALSKYVTVTLKSLDSVIIPDDSKGGKTFELGNRTWNELTVAEKEELRVKNPKLYEDLKNNRNTKK